MAAEAVRRLSGDISACIDKVLKLQAAELVQLRVLHQLGWIALLPLRVLAAAATELPNVDADMLRTLHELSTASLSVGSMCKAATQEPHLPPGTACCWAASQCHPNRRPAAFFC